MVLTKARNNKENQKEIMKFNCLFINKRTNERINKEFTEAEIDKYLGDYVKDRAIKRGQTNTTVVKRGDHWKVLVKYLKN